MSHSAHNAVRSHFMPLGVRIETSRRLARFDRTEVELKCTYSGCALELGASPNPEETLKHDRIDAGLTSDGAHLLDPATKARK